MRLRARRLPVPYPGAMSRGPSAKPSPAVYRRRRLVALLVLLVVIALVWWLVSALLGAIRGEGSDPQATEATASTPTSTAAQTDPVETGDVNPTPTASATPTPEPTPTPTVCTEAEVAVRAVVDAESYGEGEAPQFSVQLENTSEASCIIDVGTASQVYTVMSGSDTIWVSTHCQADAESQVVELEAGKIVDAPSIEWARERSSEDTCESEGRPDAVAGGAYYSLSVKVGGITSEPAYFSLR